MSDDAQESTRTFSRILDSQRRQARHVVSELIAVRGLMPLLMKARNGGQWSPEEKAELLGQLRRLSRLSPHLLLLLLPGSVLLLPVYAWWLDRRRRRRPVPGETGALPDSLRR